MQTKRKNEFPTAEGKCIKVDNDTSASAKKFPRSSLTVYFSDQKQPSFKIDLNEGIELEATFTDIFEKLKIRLVLGNVSHIEKYLEMHEAYYKRKRSNMQNIALQALIFNGISESFGFDCCLVLEDFNKKVIGFAAFRLYVSQDKSFAEIHDIIIDIDKDPTGIFHLLLLNETVTQIKKFGEQYDVLLSPKIMNTDADKKLHISNFFPKQFYSRNLLFPSALHTKMSEILREQFNVPVSCKNRKVHSLTNIEKVGMQEGIEIYSTAKQYAFLQDSKYLLMSPISQITTLQLFADSQIPNQSLFCFLRQQNPYQTKHKKFYALALKDKDDGCIKAAIFFKIEDAKSKATIQSVMVEDDCKRHKLGSILLLAAIQQCMEVHCKNIVLYTTDEGRPLYIKFGFAPYDANNEECFDLPMPAEDWYAMDIKDRINYVVKNETDDLVLDLSNPQVKLMLNERERFIEEQFKLLNCQEAPALNV